MYGRLDFFRDRGFCHLQELSMDTSWLLCGRLLCFKVWIVHHCCNLPWASASPGCEVACCFPHLLIAAFQKGLMALLVASLAFVFCLYTEEWIVRLKRKKRGALLEVSSLSQGVTQCWHQLPCAEPGSASLCVAGAVAKPFCCIGWSEGCWGGAPGLKRREGAAAYAELGALSGQSSILGGTLGGLGCNSKWISEGCHA